MKLFDSSVLISYTRGEPDARGLLRPLATNGDAAASVLSRTEVEGGMRSAERAVTRAMFERIHLEPVSDPIAIRAAEFMRTYRRSHQMIGAIDCIIAATAELLGAELLTLNVRHFPMFEGLEPAF